MRVVKILPTNLLEEYHQSSQPTIASEVLGSFWLRAMEPHVAGYCFPLSCFLDSSIILVKSRIGCSDVIGGSEPQPYSGLINPVPRSFKFQKIADGSFIQSDDPLFRQGSKRGP